MAQEAPKFTPNELVWYEKDGEIHSSGYKVESLFKTLGISPMSTPNKPLSGGGVDSSEGAEQVSDLFRYMGVPVGLSTVLGEQIGTQSGGRGKKAEMDYDIQRVEKGLIPSSLYDKLTELAGPETDTSIRPESKASTKSGKRKTRRKVSPKKKTTRRKHRK